MSKNVTCAHISHCRRSQWPMVELSLSCLASSKWCCTHVDEHDDDHFDVLGNIGAVYCWKNFGYSTSLNCFRRSRHFFVHSYKQNKFSIESNWTELKYIQLFDCTEISVFIWPNFFVCVRMSLISIYGNFDLLIRSKNMSVRFRAGWWFERWRSIAEWTYVWYVVHQNVVHHFVHLIECA